MNEQLAPSTVCYIAAALLFLAGMSESWLGARWRNPYRQRGGYGMICVGLILALAGIVLSIFGVG